MGAAFELCHGFEISRHYPPESRLLRCAGLSQRVVSIVAGIRTFSHFLEAFLQ